LKKWTQLYRRDDSSLAVGSLCFIRNDITPLTKWPLTCIMQVLGMTVEFAWSSPEQYTQSSRVPSSKSCHCFPVSPRQMIASTNIHLFPTAQCTRGNLAHRWVKFSLTTHRDYFVAVIATTCPISRDISPAPCHAYTRGSSTCMSQFRHAWRGGRQCSKQTSDCICMFITMYSVSAFSSV